MPDQPADPLHYNMKIPPVKKQDKPGDTPSPEQQPHGSDRVTDDSNTGQSARDSEKPAPKRLSG